MECGDDWMVALSAQIIGTESRTWPTRNCGGSGNLADSGCANAGHDEIQSYKCVRSEISAFEGSY